MEYTKEQRQQIAEAFKAAKPHLARSWNDSGRCLQICYAIYKGAAPYAILPYGAKGAQGVIMSRLSPYPSVSIWLEQHGYFRPKHSLDLIQEFRHRWLDELIREFST